MRLLLVRHGQTGPNTRGELATAAPGPGLTTLGDEQARALVPALADVPVTSLWASTLVRTQRTVAPLATHRGLPVTLHAGLREIEAGDLEMRRDAPAVDRYVETVVAWAAGDLDRRMPGAADGHAFLRRFDEAVAALVADGGPVALAVSHGAAIRCWVGARAANVGAAFVADRALGNTGVAVLEGHPDDGWHLTHWEGEPLLGPPPGPADPTGAPAGATA